MYTGFIAKINVQDHFDPKYTKVKIGTVLGESVIVGPDTKQGQLGVFFPADGQLSDEMCMTNSLYREHPVSGQKMGGYLENNRRVRSLMLCKVKSAGLWMPLESLEWTGVDISGFKVGDTVSTLNGKLVCQKYYTPATLNKIAKENKKKERKEHVSAPFFKKHYDTPQFKYTCGLIKPGSLVFITSKLHGTSGRTGVTKTVRSQAFSWWERILARFTNVVPKQITEYKLVNGTRNVLLETPDQVAFYDSEKFRWAAIAPWKDQIRKGETFYYELVGYTDTGKLIMPSVNPKDVGLNDLVKTYGTNMAYTYGCQPNECKLFVYRITMTNDDGEVTELPFFQVQERCAQMGLNTVPLLCEPFIMTDLDTLKAKVESVTDGPEILDPRHIREGVVIRAEGPEGILVQKNKSWTFGVLEGYIKNNDNYEDMEEAS